MLTEGELVEYLQQLPGEAPPPTVPRTAGNSPAAEMLERARRAALTNDAAETLGESDVL